MYSLVTISGLFFAGFTLGLPEWKAHPANAATLNAKEAANIVQLLKEMGYEMRRQSLTRRT